MLLLNRRQLESNVLDGFGSVGRAVLGKECHKQEVDMMEVPSSKGGRGADHPLECTAGRRFRFVPNARLSRTWGLTRRDGTRSMPRTVASTVFRGRTHGPGALRPP